MATATRTFTKAAPGTAISSIFRVATQSSRQNAAKDFFRSTRRQYSSRPLPRKSKVGVYAGITAGAALFGGTIFYLQQRQDKVPEIHLKQGSAGQSIGIFKPIQHDYQKVYNAIANRLEENDEYDDGSYAPVLLRLAWHCSGTYGKQPH